MHPLTAFLMTEVWRKVNIPPIGRRLAKALSDENENTRGIAGIGLVEAGPRSIPHINAVPPTMLSVLVIQDILAREEDDEDGTSGQDRESYSDDQDRESYS